MLLDTTESTSELGWTTYPDTGVSICFRLLSLFDSHLLELKLLDKQICIASDTIPPRPPKAERSGGDSDPAQLCDAVSFFWSWRLQISLKQEDYFT